MSGPVAEREDEAAPTGDRASASLGHALEAPTGAGVRSAAPIEGPMAQLADWFHRVITHPESIEAGRLAAADLERSLGATALEDLVTASGRLGAADRLAIYQHAYHARLIECVREDFPAVTRALGRPAFNRLARDYVCTYPSRSWDLVPYAHSLPAYLATIERPTDWPEALTLSAAIDLARLDWAMIEVTHQPLPPPISMDALAQLAPEKWGQIRLTPSRALRVHAFDHAVFPLYKALMREEPWPAPLDTRSWVAVWRTPGHMWRMSLTEVTFGLLQALMRGETLEQALAGLPDDAEEDVMRWFGAWVSDGFFASVQLP